MKGDISFTVIDLNDEAHEEVCPENSLNVTADDALEVEIILFEYEHGTVPRQQRVGQPKINPCGQIGGQFRVHISPPDIESPLVVNLQQVTNFLFQQNGVLSAGVYDEA